MAKKEIKGFNIKCLNEAGTVVLAYDAVGYYYGNKYISIDLKQTSIIDSISSKMKILNATLELTAKKWNLGPSFEGMDVYINDELIDIIVSPGKNGKILVNITNEIMNLIFPDSSEIVLKIIPRNTLSKGYVNFYTDQDEDSVEPKIIIDYIPKQQYNEQTAFQNFDCLDAGVGKINLSTGELFYEHTDIDSGSICMPFLLKHIYNSNRYNEIGEEIIELKKINNFNMGNGWKLNLQQFLFKNEKASVESGYDVYNYLDGNCNIHEFTEFYYYINNDERKYVKKEDVVINYDGSLSYNGYDVIKELKSTNGLILVSDYLTYKNDNLIELRTEDIANIEDEISELKEYINNLEYSNQLLLQNKELLLLYTEIKKLQFEIEEIAHNVSVKEVSLKEQLFAKQDLLRGLKAEFNNKFIEYYNSGPSNYSKYYNAKEENLEIITNLMNVLDSKYNTMISKRNLAYDNMDGNEEPQSSQKAYTKASNEYQDVSRIIELEQRRFSEIEQNANILYQKETDIINEEMEIITSEGNCGINELIKNKNLINEEILTLNKEYSFQNDEFQLRQIDYEISKNNKEIKKYKKRINKLNNNLISLYSITETNSIIDASNIIYSFNRYGNLISIKDSNSNKITLEYENGKVVKLIENNVKQLLLVYENNLLTEIKNFQGKSVKFFYSNNQLIKIVNEDNSTTSFKYNDSGYLCCIQNTFGYGYKIDYKFNKVEKLSEYTITKKVADNEIEYLDNELFGTVLNIAYIDLHTTTITINDEIKRTYLMDIYGNIESVFEKSNGEFFNINRKNISKTCEITTSSKKGVTNLIADINWIGSERDYKDGYGLLGGSPFSENMAYAYIDVEKVKNKRNLVLSAYVTANSAFVKKSKVDNYSNEFFDDEYWDYLCENKKNRKFELRIETVYSNGRVDITNHSFDCLNKQKQYISFPVSFIECEHENENIIPSNIPSLIHADERIVEIKVIFDYSFNINYLIFEDVQLQESDWNYIEFNENGNKIYEKSSSMLGEKFYIYDKNYLLIEEKYIENEKEENIIYKYDSSNNLIRTENNYGQVTEVLFKDNKPVGRVIYNILNPTQKFYNETEKYENGLIKCEYDERGFIINEFEYLNENSQLVSNKKLANGSRIYNGYNYKNDNIVSISQNSYNLNNANELNYTKGLLTKVMSNETTYMYDYDGFGRIISVKINNNLYLTKKYDKDEKSESTIFVNGVGIKVLYDNFGNIISKKYIDNNVEHEFISKEYDNQNRLVKLLEYENNLCYNVQEFEYDNLGNVSKISIRENDEIVTFNNDFNSKNLLQQTTVNYENYEENYQYNYNFIGKNNLENIKLPNNLVQSVEYDKLDRVSKIKYSNDLIKEFQYLQNGDHATSLVSSLIVRKGDCVILKQLIEYDSMGNISEIKENGIVKLKYYYDDVNRLIREDNRELNFTKIFEYDCNGNILTVNEYSFTLGKIDSDSKNVDVNAYENEWKDQITKHNNETFSYDNLGNPIIFKNRNLEFVKGKLLSKYDNIEYTYNNNGIRIAKKINGECIKFTLSGNKIFRQKNITSNETIYYHYGVDGLVGFNYNGIEYLYIKNLLNDITHITDIYGNVVARYEYDAWGNHKVLDNFKNEVLDSTFIGNINPFRYRSYYFDKETSLYYCNTRYYDPNLHRWINADNIDYLEPYSINGLNLYCYCFNNPVMCR